MFGAQKSKIIFELQIDFNVTNAAQWLKEGGDFDNLGKKHDWFKDEENEYGILHPVINSYIIDVVPVGKDVDAYYHRKVNKIANNAAGIDFLNNIEDKRLKHFCDDNDIKMFEWGYWRSRYLTASVNQKLAIIVPLDNFVELQVNGQLSRKSMTDRLNSAKGEREEIPVPSAFNEDGSVKKYSSVWYSTGTKHTLGYANEIVSISADARALEVEY